MARRLSPLFALLGYRGPRGCGLRKNQLVVLQRRRFDDERSDGKLEQRDDALRKDQVRDSCRPRHRRFQALDLQSGQGGRPQASALAQGRAGEGRSRGSVRLSRAEDCCRGRGEEQGLQHLVRSAYCCRSEAPVAEVFTDERLGQSVRHRNPNSQLGQISSTASAHGQSITQAVPSLSQLTTGATS